MRHKLFVWFYGLLAAVIQSFVTALNNFLLLPDVFNFSHAGLVNFAKAMAIPTISAVCMYIKQSPLPSLIEETTTVQVTKTINNV